MIRYKVVHCTLLALFVASAAETRDRSARSITKHDAERTAQDSIALRRRAQEAAREFVASWRRAWLRSEKELLRQRAYGNNTDRRVRYMHCHVTTSAADGFDGRFEPILARSGVFTRCPSWILGPRPDERDEADQIDVGLMDSFRGPVRATRRQLLTVLDGLQLQLPGDSWILGQRVRFRLDQGLHDEALVAAQSCRVDRWWCGILLGYVLASRGDLVGASSAYAVAASGLPPSVRCEWTDIQSLLSGEVRAAAASLPCATRDSLSRTYWWLADPLFSEPLNERELEHYVRKTTSMLRSAIEMDEHYGWHSQADGGVTSQMLMRYGVPTTSVWVEGIEHGHDEYLMKRGSQPSPPYPTAEYSSGRLAFGARSDAVMAPFDASSDAWELRPPSGTRDSIEGPGSVWWPREHMRWRRGQLATLAESQWAMLRRETHARLITTLNVNGEDELVRRIYADSTVGRLMMSAGPDRMRAASEQSYGQTSRLQFDVLLDSVPVIASVESQSMRRAEFARTRRGLRPPRSLQTLSRDSIAVSEPVLFRIAGDSLPRDVEAMLPLMLGTTTLSRQDKVGVFWESYGIRAGDSVRVQLAVVPLDDPGLLRRLGAALRLVSGVTDGIAIAWQDPRERAMDNGDDVPISPRALAVDLSQLPVGRYALEIAVSTPRRAPVRGRREFLLR